MTFTKVLRDKGLGERATAHGFRSSFKNWCAEVQKAADEVSEAALAHTIKDRVKAAYLRTDFFEERRSLMKAWARHCQFGSALGSKPRGAGTRSRLMARATSQQHALLSQVVRPQDVCSLVKAWAAIAERDPARYSGHSLRRTKAVLVYRETNNAELVRQMLGHTSLAHTVAYLGVRGEDVSAMSRRFEI
jgi:integrase